MSAPSLTGNIALHIPADHPSFAGHFPGAPLVPGVVLLDEALLALSDAIGLNAAVCSIASAKFLSPVRPGDPLDLRYSASRATTSEQGGEENMLSVRFDIASGERKVASATVRAALLR